MTDDLKPFYVRSLEDRQQQVEASLGDAALAEFGTKPPAPAAAALTGVNIDPSKLEINLSKVPGYKPSWVPPQQRLRMISPVMADQALGFSRPEDAALNPSELSDAQMSAQMKALGLDPETGMHPAAAKLGEYLFNVKTVSELQRKLTSPEGIGLVEGLGIVGPPITPGLSATMPIINAVMHTAREVLDAGGVPEPYATIGEYAAAMLVPVPYVGNVPGSAYRPPRAA